MQADNIFMLFNLARYGKASVAVPAWVSEMTEMNSR